RRWDGRHSAARSCSFGVGYGLESVHHWRTAGRGPPRGSSWQARGAILSTPLPRAAAARTPVAPQAAARPLPRHPHPAEPERGVLADADEFGGAQERQERPGVAPVRDLAEPAFEHHVLAPPGRVAPHPGPVDRALVDLDGAGERLELRLL